MKKERGRLMSYYYYDEELVVRHCDDYNQMLAWSAKHPNHVVELHETTCGESRWFLRIEFASWRDLDLAGDHRPWTLSAQEIIPGQGVEFRYREDFTDFSEASAALERIKERISSDTTGKEGF